MINVAICEDSDIDMEILKGIVESQLNCRNILYEIHTFSNGEELVEEYKNKPCDIIFLDIMMDGMNGIETGKCIREMDTAVEIVYCTATKEFAIEAYDVHAMGYLLKPYDASRIGIMIDYYIKNNLTASKSFITVKSKRKQLIIPYKDIVYMESDNKVVYIYTNTQGPVKVYNRLNCFEEEVADVRFLRCHQSYFINMDYVVRVEDSDFVMSDKSIIPIRKSGRKLIIKKYEGYLKKSER